MGVHRIVHRSDAGPYPLAVVAFDDRPVKLQIIQHSGGIRVVHAIEMSMLEGHLDPVHIDLADNLNPGNTPEAVRLDTVTAMEKHRLTFGRLRRVILRDREPIGLACRGVLLAEIQIVQRGIDQLADSAQLGRVGAIEGRRPSRGRQRQLTEGTFRRVDWRVELDRRLVRLEVQRLQPQACQVVEIMTAWLVAEE